jgi:hypothetical protein
MGFWWIPVLCWLLACRTANAQTSAWTGTLNATEQNALGGCTIVSGGGVAMMLSSSGGNISGTAVFNGIACYYPANCSIAGYATSSGSVNGILMNAAITLNCDGTLTGPCGGSGITCSITGTTSGNVLVGTITVQLGGGPGSGTITLVNPKYKPCGSSCDTPGNCPAGDPVSLATGNLYEEVKDYKTSGINPLSFTRYYNSLGDTNTHASMLGQNWRSTYDRNLRRNEYHALLARRWPQIESLLKTNKLVNVYIDRLEGIG